jgi:hypothetical protein
LELDRPDVALGLVVGERHSQVIQEPQRLVAVGIQARKQVGAR